MNNEKQIVKISARKRALDFTNNLKSGVYEGKSQDAFLKLVVILLDWGQEQYIQKASDDHVVFFNLFNACEENKKLTIIENEDFRYFLRSLFFSLSRTMGILEDDFKGNLLFVFNSYLSSKSLLSETKDAKTYQCNINYLKYCVWGGIEIEEDKAIYDLSRLISVLVPLDGGKSFGYSKPSISITGDGVFNNYSLEISFGDLNDDVSLEMLEKSLTAMIKLIKDGYDAIRDVEGDIGWVDIMGKFYEKCNDPVFLTKKFGLKLSLIYHIHKQNLINKEG